MFNQKLVFDLLETLKIYSCRESKCESKSWVKMRKLNII